MIGDDHRAERPGEQAHDPVADVETGDTGADLGDHTRPFEAEQAGVAGVEAERVEDVAEVDARGPHGDAHLAVGQRGQELRAGFERQVVQGAAVADPEPPGGDPGRRHQGAVTRRPPQHRNEQFIASYGELVLGADQRQCGTAVGGRLHVEESDPPGVLGLRRAGQTPYGGQVGVHVRVRHRGHGRPG